MKKRFLSIILVTILLITMVPDVFAAITVTTSPYNGDYLLAINTSTDATTTQYSGNMSEDTTSANNTMLSLNTTNSSSSNMDVSDVKDDNGQKVYEVDPRNKLANMQAPVAKTSTMNAQYDMSTYQVAYSIGSQRQFLTSNFYLEQYEYKYFTLKYSSAKCNIWLENNSTVNLSSTNINSLGSEFDNTIEPNITTNFGQKYDRDGDGKTAILLYDVQDGFDIDTNPYCIGGYFNPRDLSANGYNDMDVVYIDTYPIMGLNKTTPNVTGAYSTMAHEDQHLINYSYSYTHRQAEMPLFLNEGLSMAAQHMLYGTLSSRISAYNSSTYIRDGQSLFDWDNGDAMSNYALSYLFVQYLRAQTKAYSGGGTAIYKWLIQNNNGAATVVENMMQQFYSTITFDDIQKNFRMATVLKEDTGAQGFMGESEFDSVSPLLYTGSGTYLRGGGSVVKAISSPVTPTGYGSNVKFVGFKWDKVATPVASVASGAVASGTNVTLSTTTSGATIRYTTDGITPTSTTGTVYSSAISITANTTIKAIAYKSGMSDSDVATYTYTIIQKVATPTANVASGAVASGTNVTLSTTTSGATIRYTTDGTTPTSTTGTVYSSVISINANTTIKAIAYKSGMSDSDVTSYIYTIQGQSSTLSPAWKVLCGGIFSSNSSLNSVEAVDDGYVAVGYSDSFGVTQKGYRDAIIIKFDLDRNELWKSSFGGAGYDEFYSVTSCNDGYVAVGYSNPSGTGDWDGMYGNGYDDAIIVKYDTTGNIVWKKFFGGSNSDCFKSVCTDADGYVAVGYSNVFGTGDWANTSGKGASDAIIVKYDANGTVVWKNNFGGSGTDAFHSVLATSDGYIAVGSSNVFGNGDWANNNGNGGVDAIIVKYNKNGAIVWKKNFGRYSTDIFRSVIATSDGYVLVGETYYSSGRYYDGMIVKYDFDGNLLWERNFGSSGYDGFISVTEVLDGYIAAGYSSAFCNGDWAGVTGKGSNDAIIVKYDKSGNLVYKNNFGGSGTDYFMSIKSVIGGIVVVGTTANSNVDWIGSKGTGYCAMVKFNNPFTQSNSPLSCTANGLYNGTTQLNLFPQLAGTYTIKAQYINTTGKILNASFVVAIRSNNKLLKTYIIPTQNIAIDGVVDLSKDIELPSATSSPNLEVKLMAFDGISTLTPLANSISIGR